MDRQVDFFRTRHMLCADCDHRWIADLDWIDKSESTPQGCPNCGGIRDDEPVPFVTVAPDDLALNGAVVPKLAWYHTSTRADWPRRDIDPAAELPKQLRRMMGGRAGVASWVGRERSKALHVGTFESAIHNMFRRIYDEGDKGKQFYLYRVRLKPSVTIREGWLADPSDAWGHVTLDEVCPPGVDVARYLNYHEDLGSLSLALGRDAIASTQQIAIPATDSRDQGWVAHAVSELAHAVENPAEPPTKSRLLRRPSPSPQTTKAQELTSRLLHRLPVDLRFPFQAAVSFDDAIDHAVWASYVTGLLEMIEHPELTLSELDSQEPRLV